LSYNDVLRRVSLTPDALRQFKKLTRAIRPLIKEAIRTQLIESDPCETTRNKFRLRRASPHADYELRAEPWRVFYRVDGENVLVTLIGEKRGAALIVEGEELRL
jgi:mRNA-degrading endonuclease RelE of RelBE toxin-antitoxin system